MSESFSCDAVVIGAGAVGLAVARALAMRGLNTVILEKNSGIGLETSSRNSEVIHAGLYYPAGSLKTRLCVEGRRLLYDFCAGHGVPHNRIGKWLVATTSREEEKLEKLLLSARDNGVDDLAWVSAQRARQEAPQLRHEKILESPSTGILDAQAYMRALLGDAEAAQASLVRNAEVRSLARRGEGWRMAVRNNNEDLLLETRLVVNSAGLWARAIARVTEGLAAGFVPPLFLAKGSYAAIAGPVPFRRLIYPLPAGGGLGVHLTLDLDGAGRLGPDAVFLDHDDPARIDYGVEPDIATRFAEAVRRWWPDVPAERLAPAYSGVRPRIARDTEIGLDFRVDGPGFHGLPGLVNLFGIESPGLTASLAIAGHVEGLLCE